MNNDHENSTWPEKLVISSRYRYTKKHGGVIWKIKSADFIEDRIYLVSLETEEHKVTDEWSGSGHEFIEKFVNIE
ncbi:hypothetical protein C8R34_12429 [Nitrosomonas sp. Nm84]|uniref:hypothetical protein n=1 Tax=Nitrosomonas sp. Nm84 TaxID=200124 RepID=UPI000D766DAE|nr:hypothetical protein [Nitrosomonas sp. Nm84]PXW84736.1 hypothetical protein C8R34_12429 [Nitrosomonas sp. Nm84]